MNREDGRDGAGRSDDNREESRNRAERAGGSRGNGGSGGFGGRYTERREGFRNDRGERGERPSQSDRRGYRDQGGPSGGRSGSRDRDERGARPFRSGERGGRPYGDRPQRQGGGFGGRYGFRDRDDSRGREGRPFTSRYERDDRDGFGGRPPRRTDQERGYGRDDRSAKGYERPDRPRRPYGDRDSFRDKPRRTPADRPGGSFRDRDDRRSDRDRAEGAGTFRGRGPGGSGDRSRRQPGGDRGARPFGRDRGAARPFSRDERGGSRSRYGRPEETTRPKTREELPQLDPGIRPDELDREVRAELRSLPGDLADLVARHLVAAARALSAEDPEKAYEHAKVARRFAGRIGVVREATGIAAYHAGQYAEALSDLRAARRITGSDEYLPIMADCERGLGRPERALDLVRSPEAGRLDRMGRIELAIVESGARRDLGQHEAAVITLQRVPELRDPEPKPWSARLAFAYADALADAGHEEAATDWFARAMAFDEDGETDAAIRYAELTGGLIEDLEEDFDGPGSENGDPRGGLPDDLLGDEEPDGEKTGGADTREAAEDQADEADHIPGGLPHDDLAEENPPPGEPANEGPSGDEVRAAAEPPAFRGPQPESPHVVPPAPGGRETRAADDAEPTSAKTSAPSYGPAFIEPDFGDALDDSEVSEDRVERRP